jgi:hypothetical protein
VRNEAITVLNILSDISLEGIVKDKYDFYINTAALYNGRERGICLTVHSYRINNPCSLKCFQIFFSEHRSSDNMFVMSWKGTVDTNPPTIKDIPDEAWDSQKFFNWGQYHETAYYIKDLVENYIREQYAEHDFNQEKAKDSV